jgi:hypothetical protein
MMDDNDLFMDPGEPGELKGSLRAKDLINKPLLIQPLHEDTVAGQDEKPWHFVECNVAVIGMGGVEDHASGVRISWVRVLPQLTDRLSEKPNAWIAGIPKVQQDNSVILTPFSDKGKDTARQLMPQVIGLFKPSESTQIDITPPSFAPGEEPF